MKKIIQLLIGVLIILVMSFNVHSQNSKIIGQLADSVTNEALMSATVVLLQPADSVIASFNITNVNGEFVLRRVKPGDYLLQISYVGYDAISRPLVVAEDKPEIDLGTIKLQQTAALLDQATIVDERTAVRISKDTIIYNADAFKTQPNDLVEDLLKKMPGIEIDKDGTITAEGEEVEQVLVDGKAFFGGDAKMATKNLPARAIKEVQVFDKASDMATFSGVDDGLASKTINLKLKEEYKKGVFGTVTAGVGNEERYNGKFNINSFNKKNQVSFIGQLNNTNEQGFSINDYVNFMGGMARLMSGSNGGRIRLGSNNTAIPVNSDLANGDTKTQGIGFNFNRDFTKQTKLNVTYFYSGLDNQTEDQIERNYFQATDPFSTDVLDIASSKNQNHRASARLDHEIDSTQSIILSTSFTTNDQFYLSQVDNKTISGNKVLQNQSIVKNDLDGMSSNIDSELTYRKKFKKKGRSVVGNISYSNAPSDQDANLESNNIFYLDSTSNQVLQDQFEHVKEREIGFSSTWTEPLGKRKYLGVTYAYNQIDNESEKEVYDLVSAEERIRNTDLSNAYDQQTTYHKVETALRWIKDKSNFNIKLGLQQSHLDGEIVGAPSAIQTDYLYALPSLDWNYDFSRTKSFSLNYRTNVTEPSLSQLQPIIDNSDPLEIRVGNPALRPEYSHRIGLRFRNFSQFANTSLFGNINLTFTQNEITNSTTIDRQFIQTITPVNIDNTFRGTGYVSFGAPLRFIDSQFKVGTNATYSNGITFINNEENKTERLSNSFNLSIENKKKEVLDWSVGGEFEHSKTVFTDTDRGNQKFSNQTYWADLTKPIKSWSISSGIDTYIYSDNFSDDSQVLPIWKASISKFIMQQKGEIKLSAFDILNRNQGYEQNLDLNYIEEIRSKTLAQYFLLSFTYNVGAFKQNSFMRSGHGGRRR